MPGREGASLWERFESREGAEIGVSLITPHLVRQLQKKLYLKAKQDSDSRLCAAGVNCMRLRANPIGEPDAANLHVRFDERGAETEAMVWTATPAFGESCRQQLSPRPNATAPLLDSTAAATRENDRRRSAIQDRPWPVSSRGIMGHDQPEGRGAGGEVLSWVRHGSFRYPDRSGGIARRLRR